MTTPLPRTWYLDESHFELELDAVFGRSWLPAAHVTDLDAPGSYLAIQLGGREIIVVHGDDGIVRAFHNVCQHRAHRLLEGKGRLAGAITCPYHAWSYHLDGRLRFARNAGQVKNFDESCFGLSEVAATSFAGFVVVCFEPGAREPTAGWSELESRLLADYPSLPAMREVRRREAVLAANWKTVVENYLECYHCNVAHPSFGDFDLSTWKHLLGEGWSRQGRVVAGMADDDIGHGDIAGFSAWWQWPNIFWSRAYDADSFIGVFHEPLSASRTRQTRVVYSVSGVEDGALQAFNDLFDDVFAEDIALVEGVQQGLASPGYRGGILMCQPESRAGWSEHALVEFQNRVRVAVEGQ